MHREFILNLLDEYSAFDEAEHQMHQALSTFVRENARCFDRSLTQGHITGSAWLVDRNFQHVFFTHHKKLNRWFQPGGHSDGDPNTLAVSMREASEESGIEDVFIQPVDNSIFDIDVHTIPANKKEAEHLHYDIRFLLETDMRHPLRISEESNEIAWINLENIPEYTQEDSILRMIDKMTKLQGHK